MRKTATTVAAAIRSGGAVGDDQRWGLVGHLIYGLLLVALYIMGRQMPLAAVVNTRV